MIIEATSVTNAPVRMHDIPKGTYRHRIRLCEIKAFLEKLSSLDLELLMKRATFTIDENKQDERSIFLPLSHPIEIEGKILTAIRLKGVLPRSSDGKRVEPYTSGRGFSDRKCHYNGVNRWGSENGAVVSALGTMTLKQLEKELNSAMLLGPDRTDPILGFGCFSDLEFNGLPVGFIIYGVERPTNRRILSHTHSYIFKHQNLPPGACELAEHTGRLLREMHELGQFHRYPHLGNFGIVDATQARILDLESAVAIASIPPEHRAAFAYLDLARTINDYMKKSPHFTFSDDDERDPLTMTPLLPNFFKGYFRTEQDTTFMRRVLALQGADATERFFGSLPLFGPGWRCGDQVTLVEPIIRVMSAPADTEIDITPLLSHPLFGPFYEAIEQVAKQL